MREESSGILQLEAMLTMVWAKLLSITMAKVEDEVKIQKRVFF